MSLYSLILECEKGRLVALPQAHLAARSPWACEFSRACPTTRAIIKVSIRAFSATLDYAVADANILATVGPLLPDTSRRCSGFQQAPTLVLLQDALQQAGCEPIVTVSIYFAPLRDGPTASLRDQRCHVNCAGGGRADGGAGVPAPWRYIGQIFAIEVPVVEALLTFVIEHNPPAALGLLHLGGVGAERRLWAGRG
jgi:hypothetical protein